MTKRYRLTIILTVEITTTRKENTMTKTEAINYIRSEMRMVLDDDYPDKMESLVDELVDGG